MSNPDEAPEVEFKDGNLFHKGKKWSPHTLGVTFYVSSLFVQQSISHFSGKQTFETCLGGEAHVECRGLLVPGRNEAGTNVLNLRVEHAESEWLSKEFEEVAPIERETFPSRAHLFYYTGDSEFGLSESFDVSLYLERDLFEKLVASIRSGNPQRVWFHARFAGLYTDFEYGQSEDVRLALAPPTKSRSSVAYGRLNGLSFAERTLHFQANSPWTSRYHTADGGQTRPTSQQQGTGGSAQPRPDGVRAAAPSSVNVIAAPVDPRIEGLLSQIAVSARWIVWGLIALTVVAALHLR